MQPSEQLRTIDQMKMMKLLFAILMAMSLLACNNSSQETTADEVAVAFFDAIYNKKDLQQAKNFCTADFAKQLTQYKTAKNAARRLFNMSFDSTKIDAALADFKVREEFNNSGNLTILFTGDRDGKTYKELKRVRLVKQGQTWLVDELLKDPVPS